MFDLHAVMAEEARRSGQDTNSVMEALLVSVYWFFIKDIMTQRI